MANLPEFLCNSLAWDRGSEFALHKDISNALDLDVDFGGPHSPWQRGANENTNRLLQQYFLRSTNLSAYSESYFDAVADELNDRPRKTTGWRKSADAIPELINKNC
ncbi:hypothetical protein GCM10010407_19100 [Rarobacter incanus]